MSKSDDYIEKMKLQLDKLKAKMSALEDKAKEAKADARAKYAEEMGKLRQQSQQALTKLEEVRVAGEGSWDGMVAEMEKIRDAFVHSFKYFKSPLQAEPRARRAKVRLNSARAATASRTAFGS